MCWLLNGKSSQCNGQPCMATHVFHHHLPFHTIHIPNQKRKQCQTRMHSSRMRTVRCNDRRGGVCPGVCLPREVSVCLGGVCQGDIPACTGQGGVSQHALDRGSVCPGGVCPGGGGGCLPKCTLGYTPPEQNDRCLWKNNLALTTFGTVTNPSTVAASVLYSKQICPDFKSRPIHM